MKGEEPGRLAVLGAGTMGGGIAHVAAAAGYDVSLYDVDAAALAAARRRIDATLAGGVEKGKITARARDETLGRITTTPDLAGAVAGVGLVVEAVPEEISLKKALFARVSALAPEEAILATNTSCLSVTEIAAAARRSERVVGMHFFNPPHALKLLEIVRAEQTSAETVAGARAAGERMGREMIVVSDSAGFATSRLGLVLGLEAMRMVEQGVASPQEIDRAMVAGYGHAMGPLRVTDLVGLDVRLAIAEHLHAELGGEQYRPPQILRRMVRAGRLGKKAGRGFYSW